MMVEDEQQECELKGYERALNLDPVRIAHALHVRCATSVETDLLPRAPIAWKWVMQRHPRLRATPSVSKTTGEPIAKINSTSGVPNENYGTIANESSFEVVTQLEVDGQPSWQDIVWKACHVPRKDNPLSAMTILVQSSTTATIILYTDHAFSDGFSGYVVLRDFLRVVSSASDIDSKSEPNVSNIYAHLSPISLPLQPPIMDKLQPKTTWTCTSYFRRLFYRLMAWLFYQVLKVELSSFHSILHGHLLPREPLQVQEEVLQHGTSTSTSTSTTTMNTVNKMKSTKNFATGTTQNLREALTRCRAEDTTLHGPLCLAIALAIAHSTGKITPSNSHVILNTSIDYDLRRRVEPSMGLEHVGCNIGVGFLATWMTKGLDLSGNFWQTAKEVKSATDAGGKGLIFRALFSLSHYELSSPKRLEAMGRRSSEGVGGDVNISNLGRWPFEKECGEGKIKIEGVHLYHRTLASGLDAAIVFFITSVDTLHMAMTSRLADQTMADTIFQKAVKMMEAIGKMEPDMTVRDFLKFL